MANSRNEFRNSNWMSGALTLTEQTVCPISSGMSGLWNDGGVVKMRNADGTDTVIASGAEVSGAIRVHAVATATLASLFGNPFTYDNGTAGVGATLTGDANGAFPTVDGVAAALNNIYLVTAQAAGAQNGAYKLTTLGAGGAAPVLTRIEEFDASGEMKDGTAFVARGGTLNADTLWRYTGSDSPTVGTTSLTFARDPLVVTTNTAQTISGVKTFTNAARPLINNSADTFSTALTSAATANRTATLPDASVTLASAGVATGGASPAFTGTAPTAAENFATPAFSGTGFATAGQVVTTTDNQTMTLNQCAGMWLLTATQAPAMIASNTAVTGAPAVLTVYGLAPVTDAGTYKIVAAPTPAGTVASHTHTQA